MKRILTSALVFLVISLGLVLMTSCACAGTMDHVAITHPDDCCGKSQSCHSFIASSVATPLDFVLPSVSRSHREALLNASDISHESFVSLFSQPESLFNHSPGLMPSKEKTYLQISLLLI